MRRSFLSAALALISVAAAGASRHRGVDRRGVLNAIAQAPAETRRWKNLYHNQPGAIAAGAKLYRQHCAECHGNDARGIGHAANLRSTSVQNATPGELEWFLQNGNLASGMPEWSGLPEQRRWQIVSYLKTLH